MLCRCTRLIKTLLGIFLVGHIFVTWAFDSDAEMAARYKMQVDRLLVVPEPETRKYAKLANEALNNAGLMLEQSQYVVVVDRDPSVQALLLYWRSPQGEFRLVGASPVSTGRPGSYEHFETPVGVFDHSTANLDFRAEGTRNSEGIRGYGDKGLRIYDLGWQRVPRGWGDGAVSDMRLQMHATDPDLLERRLGSVQSKGCIRIPATLNRLLDHYGLLDADYEQALRDGRKLWMLDAQREPVPDPGRYVVVVDSKRQDRPDWTPAPFLPHRKPARPTVKK
jgi:hypothetical protein